MKKFIGSFYIRGNLTTDEAQIVHKYAGVITPFADCFSKKLVHELSNFGALYFGEEYIRVSCINCNPKNPVFKNVFDSFDDFLEAISE